MGRGIVRLPKEPLLQDREFLIVEDNAQARNALATLLKSRYEVEACDTAEAARERFPKFRPDVLTYGYPIARFLRTHTYSLCVEGNS